MYKNSVKIFQRFWLKIQMNRKLALGLFLKVLKYLFKLKRWNKRLAYLIRIKR